MNYKTIQVIDSELRDNSHILTMQIEIKDKDHALSLCRLINSRIPLIESPLSMPIGITQNAGKDKKGNVIFEIKIPADIALTERYSYTSTNEYVRMIKHGIVKITDTSHTYKYLSVSR